MTLREILKYTPGKGCKCHAACDWECACDTNWTSRNEFFLEWKLRMYSSLVREWFIEYYEHSVTKQTTTELSDFADILNEPLRIDLDINPKLERWIDTESLSPSV